MLSVITMLSLPCRFRSDEVGATGTEYAMLMALVALAIAVRAQALGNAVDNLLISVGSAASQITLPPL